MKEAKMTCRKVVPFIDDFADGSVDDGFGEKLQKHFSVCSKCESKLDASRRLKALLADLTFPEPDGNYFRDTTALILKRVSVEGQMQRRVH